MAYDDDEAREQAYKVALLSAEKVRFPSVAVPQRFTKKKKKRSGERKEGYAHERSEDAD